MSSVFMKNILKYFPFYDKLLRKKIELEGKEVSPPLDLFEGVCWGNNSDGTKKMEELKISLESAVQQLISMFEATGRQYSCNRTKLGKLLSIFAFEEACEGRIVFSEKIRKYSDCGTKIDELVLIVPREIYFSNEENDSGKIIEHYSQESFDIEEGKKLYEVFIRFGAYNGIALGRLITGFISLPGVLTSEDTVDLDAVFNLSKKNFSDIQDCNELIDFLKTHGNR